MSRKRALYLVPNLYICSTNSSMKTGQAPEVKHKTINNPNLPTKTGIYVVIALPTVYNNEWIFGIISIVIMQHILAEGNQNNDSKEQKLLLILSFPFSRYIKKTNSEKSTFKEDHIKY